MALPTFVIAEAGVNHNGSLERALELIEVAAEAGADAIKFQTFTAEKVVGPQAKKAAYQMTNDGPGSQFEMLKKLELDEKQHRELMGRSRECGIEFMSTPFDEAAADFLVAEGMKRIKIPSGEITNHPFLMHLASKNVPMILSTGMASMEEVEDAVSVISKILQSADHQVKLDEYLTLLHCTSNYPASVDDVNLLAMLSMKEATGLPIGYSDHTLGIAVCPAAVAIGASIIEKHFTLDCELPGPDHRASLEPEELKTMIRQIRNVEAAMGCADKQPTAAEEEMRITARRSVAAAADLEPGDTLTPGHLTILRPATGIHPKHYFELEGRIVRKPIKQGSPINWDDLATGQTPNA